MFGLVVEVLERHSFPTPLFSLSLLLYIISNSYINVRFILFYFYYYYYFNDSKPAWFTERDRSQTELANSNRPCLYPTVVSVPFHNIGTRYIPSSTKSNLAI